MADEQRAVYLAKAIRLMEAYRNKDDVRTLTDFLADALQHERDEAERDVAKELAFYRSLTVSRHDGVTSIDDGETARKLHQLWQDSDEAHEGVIDLALSMIVGEPKPYTWAKQNYNAGHDQALHGLVKELRRRRAEEG